MTLPAEFNMAGFCIGRAARAHPDKIALVVVRHPAEAAEKHETWTYAAIEDAVLRIAGDLADLGLERGDRLLIRLDNTSTYALLFFGAIAAGIVPLPTSTQLTEPEALFLLPDCGAKAIALADDLPLHHLPKGLTVLSTDDIARMAREGRRAKWAETAANDPAFLIYTSGTTAHPKGVLHAQRSAWGRRPMIDGWYGLSDGDRVLHAGAFNWTYTLGTGLTDPWANAATAIVYTGEKDPALWPRLIADTGATIFAAVPSLYRQILKYAAPTRENLGALRHGLIAGETPPPGLFEDWKAATGRELYEALGMSEVSTYISSSPSVPRKPGRIGKPQAGRRVAILPVDAGETPLPAGKEGLLAVHRSDPGLMLGYWNRKDEEAEVFRGEWFIGGDLGEDRQGGLRQPSRPRQRPDEGARLSCFSAGGRGRGRTGAGGGGGGVHGSRGSRRSRRCRRLHRARGPGPSAISRRDQSFRRRAARRLQMPARGRYRRRTPTHAEWQGEAGVAQGQP